MSRPEGAWIFLSHSTKDWHEVRRVRNLLEEKGHRPLVFFLKCLTEHAELDGLIKREIEARSWFLLCDSDNAQKSPWVQAEMAYIRTLTGKYHEQIHLDESVEAQIERIDRLCKRATVFIDYYHGDRVKARRIADALAAHDYSVWIDVDSIAPGTSWAREIEDGIEKAIDRGFVLLVVSKDSARSNSLMRGVQAILDASHRKARNAHLIAVMVDDSDEALQAVPRSLERFDFSRGSFEANIQRLVTHMQHTPME